MEPISHIWMQLHDLFDTDDGSLPEIHITYANGKATSAGYGLLRSRAATIVSENPTFYSRVHETEQPLDSVSNAAASVVAGEAEAFHVVFGGIAARGTTIPDLGVFVFPDQLALDYRMGPDWGSDELEALFGLLLELTSLDGDAAVSLEESVIAEVAQRFQEVWRRWVAENAV